MEHVLPIEVIKKVIENVDTLRGLQNCRLVNRRWNILACESLTSIHDPIQLNSDERLFNFLTCFENTVQEFPFRRFYFQLDKLENPDYFTIFTERYHSKVEQLGFELKVKHATWLEVHKLQAIFYLIQAAQYLLDLHLNISCHLPIGTFGESFLQNLRFFPSALRTLKSIQFNRDITIAKEDYDGRLALLESIEAYSPNLEQITIVPWKGTQLSRISPLLNIFKTTPRILLRNVTFATYDRLDLSFLADISSIDFHLNNFYASYKLTELHLRIKYDYDKVCDDPTFNYDRIRFAFCEWLESHSRTLEKLTLILEEVSDIQLPKLEALNSLDIGLGTYNDVDMGNPLQPFLPSQFPVLRSVTINFYSEDWNLFASRGFHSVRSLKIQGYQEEFVHEKWEQVFPNLNSLTLACLKPIQIENILQRMTTIKYLDLELCQNVTTKSLSLCHLKFYNDLESLAIHGGESTLPEIISMTQEGSLKPLVNLTISNRITDEEFKLLKSIHGNVWTKPLEVSPQL